LPEWAGAKECGERRGAQAIRGLAYFNGWLKDRAFVATDAVTMPDITLFASLLFADIAGVPVDPQLTALAAWRETLAPEDREAMDSAWSGTP
jgi:glutathione S-transferase